MANFIWGEGGRATTPEAAARQRAIAQALISRADTPAQNWAQGLGDVASAWSGSVLNQRAAEDERAGQEAVAAALAGLTPESSFTDIAGVLSNPWASASQGAVAQALLNQNMQANDPMYQMQLERAALELEALRNPAAPQPSYDFEGGQWWQRNPDGSVPFAVSEAPADDLTSAIQNYQFLIGQGIDPPTAQQQAFGGGQTNVSVNTGANGQVYPTPPFGQDYRRNPDGTVAIDPVTGTPTIVNVTGGPQATEATLLDQKGDVASGRKDTSTDTVTTAAAEARRLAGLPGNTGWTGAAWRISPFSDASELQRQIDVLKSNATIENLTAMRQASPTGGALGSVTEKEGAMLASAAGALDPNSSNFDTQLDNYEQTLFKIIHGPTEGQRIFEESRQNATSAPATAPAPAPAAATGGIDYNAAEPPANWGGDKALWRFMSPEDRALW